MNQSLTFLPANFGCREVAGYEAKQVTFKFKPGSNKPQQSECLVIFWVIFQWHQTRPKQGCHCTMKLLYLFSRVYLELRREASSLKLQLPYQEWTGCVGRAFVNLLGACRGAWETSLQGGDVMLWTQLQWTWLWCRRSQGKTAFLPNRSQKFQRYLIFLPFSEHLPQSPTYRLAGDALEPLTLLKAVSLQRPSSIHTSSRTGSTQFEMSLEIAI